MRLIGDQVKFIVFLYVTGISANNPCSDGTYQNGATFAVEACSQAYYQCNHGTVLERLCAAGTMFDPKTGCNFPNNIGCEDIIAGDPCSEGTYQEGTLFLYEDCSEYYNECVHGKTLKRPCAPGTVFDPAVGVCNHPNDVNGCGETDGCNGHDHGDLYIPDDGCYSYFYQCSHGTAYKFDCPSTLVFDPSLDVCNWPSDVPGCAGSGGCNGHSNGDYYVDGDGCYDFFYRCDHGVPVKTNCPPGTAFNPTYNVCDHLYAIPACANDNGCHGHKHGELYILDDNCYPYFYQCVHGEAYQMPCPDGLIFDTTILRCNWPSEVEGCEGDSNLKTTTMQHITSTFPTEATEPHTTRTTVAAEPQVKTYVGFVIDNTGSMKNEITAVKRWLTGCVKGSKFICGTAPTGGWIVASFNDPETQLEIGPTTNANDTISTIESLSPHKGWDCPEMAMAGLKTALDAVPYDNDGCKIFFFSDAVAKDIERIGEIVKLFLKKRCVFIPVLTSCCGPCLWPCSVLKSEFCEHHVFERTHALRRKRSTDDAERPEVAYYELAEQTGGDIFILPKPKSSRVMTSVLKKSTTLGLCGTNVIAGPPGKEYLCEADCLAMKMCWDRSISKCFCSAPDNCATVLPTDNSHCKKDMGTLLCNSNVPQDYFPDVMHCNSFFTCKWGKATHHQCEKGKVFTPMRDDHCDIPENAPGICGNGEPYPDIVML